MPKHISDERIALVLLDGPPSNPDAVTDAEFDAGERLECRIETFRLSPTASDTVPGGEFCRAVNAVVPTRSNYEGSMTVLRYLTDGGLADAGNDIAFDAVREKGATLHLVVRKGPKHDAGGAAGQEYSYFEAINDWPTDPSDFGGFLRSEVTLYVQRASLNKELVSVTVPATGATAGTPGTFTPSGATVPADIAALSGVTADPLTAWTIGQSVVLGDASEAHWSGSAWVSGAAS